MDATKVISCLTDTWTNCLDEYYDHVSTEYLKTVSEKYNISIEDLQDKTGHLKSEIMSKLTRCIPTEVNNTKLQDEKQPVATTAKEASKIIETKSSKKFNRKELHSMCADRGIKTSRKNADMIASIKEYDDKLVSGQIEMKNLQQVEEGKPYEHEPVPKVTEADAEVKSEPLPKVTEADAEADAEVKSEPLPKVTEADAEVKSEAEAEAEAEVSLDNMMQLTLNDPYEDTDLQEDEYLDED